MDLFDDAKPLDVKQLLDLCGVDALKNPVGRLFCLEEKGENGRPDALFPVLIYTAGKDMTPGYCTPEKPDGADWVMFPCSVVEWGRQGLGLVKAGIHEKDLFVTQRVWDKPPSAAALKKYPPLVSRGMQ